LSPISTFGGAERPLRDAVDQAAKASFA